MLKNSLRKMKNNYYTETEFLTLLMIFSPSHSTITLAVTPFFAFNPYNNVRNGLYEPLSMPYTNWNLGWTSQRWPQPNITIKRWRCIALQYRGWYSKTSSLAQLMPHSSEISPQDNQDLLFQPASAGHSSIQFIASLIPLFVPFKNFSTTDMFGMAFASRLVTG